MRLFDGWVTQGMERALPQKVTSALCAEVNRAAKLAAQEVEKQEAANYVQMCVKSNTNDQCGELSAEKCCLATQLATCSKLGSSNLPA